MPIASRAFSVAVSIVGLLAQNVKSYLSAVGAAAIYVSVHNREPKSVGVCRDLDRSLEHVRRLLGVPVTFGWIAWASQHEVLLAIAKMPGLMLRTREDGVKVVCTLPDVVRRIRTVADRSAVVLTSHRKAVERANVLAGVVEQVFVELRTSGQLAAFNVAYKSYRRSAQANGESVLPYWKAEEQLRRVTIRAIATSASRSASLEKLSELIAQEFPWLRADLLDNSRKQA
jgi:hypothetical protein